jgi:hypothetical protein
MIERAAKMADWLRGTYGFSPEMNAKCVQLLKDMVEEMEKIKAERDRYWQYIKDLGCDSCGGDCDRCEVGLDGVWSGWVWLPKEEV